MLVNLDTHVLIHALAGDLRPSEERVLTTRLWGAAIVLWELAKLRQLGRVQLDFDEPEVVRPSRVSMCGPWTLP